MPNISLLLDDGPTIKLYEVSSKISETYYYIKRKSIFGFWYQPRVNSFFYGNSFYKLEEAKKYFDWYKSEKKITKKLIQSA